MKQLCNETIFILKMNTYFINTVMKAKISVYVLMLTVLSLKKILEIISYNSCIFCFTFHSTKPKSSTC